MRFAFAATVALLLGSADPVAAQGEELMPELDLGLPFLAGGTVVPIEAAGVTLDIPWTYTFPANPPAGDTTIAWLVECPAGLTVQTAPTQITFAPGQQEYSGTASFPVSATTEAPGHQVMTCPVAGQVGGTADQLQASDSAEAILPIAYYGNVTVSLPTATKQAGPQKQVPYQIEVTNHGNARTKVTFEVVDKPAGKWNLLLPDALILDSPNAGTGPATGIATVVVATPFDNGYNSGSGDFVIRVHSTSADDPTAVGPSSEVAFTTKVNGMYVPGPALPALLAALALAFVWSRRA